MQQELYASVPVALAPVLGNPIMLAAFGVDTSAPLPDQAQPSMPSCHAPLVAILNQH